MQWCQAFRNKCSKTGITRWFVWEETGWRKVGRGGEKKGRNGWGVKKEKAAINHSVNIRRWDIHWQEHGHLQAGLKLMGTSEAYQDAEGNTLDDSLDSPSVQRTCVGGWSRVEVYYSGTWSGRAQGGVAKLEHLGNYPGVICQSVRVFHYICQPHKQVDKTAVIQWKKNTVLSPIQISRQ